jgi:hypothetical protein
MGITKIAVLPFDNLSDEYLPLNFTQIFHNCLKQERFEVISQDVVERFFIRRRIRRISLINETIAQELRRTLGADVFIIGSVNALTGGNIPQIDMSVQMVDTIDASTIWMNSVSFSGDDFETLLGIGKIRSLEKLVEIAFENLVSNVPKVVEKKQAKQINMVPFEIVRASFYPKVVEGEKPVELIIEVREIAGRPTYMHAIVQDKSITLVQDGERWYRGSFTSPPLEGSYILKLYAIGGLNKVFFFDALASLGVDNTPPLVNMVSRGTYISPNNDSVNDYAIFFPMLLQADTLQEWIFEVRDKDGKLIRSEEGGDALPKGLIWRGENNTFQPVHDGTYFAQLLVKDQAGHESVTDKAMVVVDRSLPEVKIISGKINKDTVTFHVESKDTSKIVGWSITIYDSSDEVVGTFSGKEDLPSTLCCSIKKSPNKQDTFTCSLEIRDAAGNLLTVEKAPLKMPASQADSLKTPANKKEDQWLEDF